MVCPFLQKSSQYYQNFPQNEMLPNHPANAVSFSAVSTNHVPGNVENGVAEEVMQDH